MIAPSLTELRANHREAATGEWFCGPYGGLTATTWHIQGAHYVVATGLSEDDAKAIVAEHNALRALLAVAEAAQILYRTCPVADVVGPEWATLGVTLARIRP